MSRPTIKKDLVEQAEENYKKLMELINKKNNMCGIQDKNDRDLLMHLHEWHKMVLNWHKSNMVGKKTSFLPKGYTWKSTPELNKSLWKQYQKTSLSEAEKLFTKNYYDWTGTTSLGAYFVSATSSHYDWATKLLKRF